MFELDDVMLDWRLVEAATTDDQEVGFVLLMLLLVRFWFVVGNF